MPVGAFETILNDACTGAAKESMMAELRFEPHLSKTTQLLTRVHVSRSEINATCEHELAPIEATTEDYRGTTLGAEARFVLTPWQNTRLTAGATAEAHAVISISGRYAGVNERYMNINQSYRFGAVHVLVDSPPLAWLRISGGARGRL